VIEAKSFWGATNRSDAVSIAGSLTRIVGT
jgi:hypothetical protein